MRTSRMVVLAVLSVLAAVALGAGQQSAAHAGPTGGFVSTIYSPSARNCIDVPGGTTDINVNLVGAPCSSAPEQLFTFVPETDPNNGLAGYILVNHASGLCAVKFRFELRQSNCAGVSPVPSGWIWRLLPVASSAHEYLLEPTYVGATATGRCMSAGTATVVYTPFCDPADPAQVMVLAA